MFSKFAGISGAEDYLSRNFADISAKKNYLSANFPAVSANKYYLSSFIFALSGKFGNILGMENDSPAKFPDWLLGVKDQLYFFENFFPFSGGFFATFLYFLPDSLSLYSNFQVHTDVAFFSAGNQSSSAAPQVYLSVSVQAASAVCDGGGAIAGLSERASAVGD
jgi:hypothetical protein